MIRILLPYVYNLAEVIEPLSTLQPNTRYGDIFYRLWMAQQKIEGLFQGSVFTPSLRSSVDSANALLNAIKQQTNHENTSIDRMLEPWDVAPITFAFTQFKTALMAEFGTFPAYFVSQKGSHDTLTLLDSPARMFPADLASKVPEAMFDVAGAGKLFVMKCRRHVAFIYLELLSVYCAGTILTSLAGNLSLGFAPLVFM